MTMTCCTFERANFKNGFQSVHFENTIIVGVKMVRSLLLLFRVYLDRDRYKKHRYSAQRK